MGVRGKVEAVIYAAEEPITLAQLAALFGEEALAEQRAARAEVTAGDSSIAPETETAPDMPAAGAGVLPFVDGGSAGETPVDRGSDGTETAQEPAADGGSLPVAEEPHQASGEPVLLGDPDADKRAGRLRDREAREAIRQLIAELMGQYDAGERGMEIREIAGGYQIATRPEYHDAVRAFAKSLKPVMKLSLQALETLAVIAYKQPVTAPEISEIRGVDSGGVLGSLIGRKLVTTAGRKQVVGRPILYKTTKEFLLRFGLKDLAELPSMEEFEKMAGELASLAEEPAGAEPAAAGPGVRGERSMRDDAAEDGAQEEEPVTEPAGEAGPDAAPEAAVEGVPEAAGEPERGERPQIGPAAISVDVHEAEPVGISVNQSGIARADVEVVPDEGSPREGTGA